MQLDYQKGLINLANTDYAKENRDITRAQEKLNQSIAERDACEFIPQELVDAKQYLKIAKDEQRQYENEVSKLETSLSDLQDAYSEAVWINTSRRRARWRRTSRITRTSWTR